MPASPVIRPRHAVQRSGTTSEMVGQASRILYGDDTRVRVEVQARPRQASFGLEFYCVSAAAPQLIPALTLDQLANIAVILGFGSGMVGGVIRLVRWLNGRNIDRVEKDGDEINITIKDESINITTNEYRVFVNPEVRKGLKALVAPLDQEGFESVDIQAANAPPQQITKAERGAFSRIPLPEEEISVDRSTAILEVVAPSFRQGLKWRFAQGGGFTFFADIVDERFLADVARHTELFGSGDALRVELEIRTVRTEDGFGFERKIVRVIEHIPAVGRGGGQLPLVE